MTGNILKNNYSMVRYLAPNRWPNFFFFIFICLFCFIFVVEINFKNPFWNGSAISHTTVHHTLVSFFFFLVEHSHLNLTYCAVCADVASGRVCHGILGFLSDSPTFLRKEVCQECAHRQASSFLNHSFHPVPRVPFRISPKSRAGSVS